MKETMLTVYQVEDIRRDCEKFNFTWRYRMCHFAEEIYMKMNNIAGMYSVKEDKVILRHNKLSAAVVFHEIGHAYDFTIDGNPFLPQLNREANAYYYAVILAINTGREELVPDIVFEIYYESVLGNNQLYTLASSLALTMLLDKNIINKEVIDLMKEVIYGASVLEVAAAFEK